MNDTSTTASSRMASDKKKEDEQQQQEQRDEKPENKKVQPFSYSKQRIKLHDVNDHLTCYICKGYYIDATTIVECLHSFCRSCIIKRLQFKSYCPVCEIMINKAKPNIKPDKTLQDIVYKLVPGLHRDEMRRRREFYKNQDASSLLAKVSPETEGSGCGLIVLDDGITAEQRGEDNERVIYNLTDPISLSLEYCSSDCDVYPTTNINNNEEVTKMETEKDGKEGGMEAMKKCVDENPPTRYLQCPAGVTVRLLKKFLIGKFDIDAKQFHVDILYKRVPLPDEYKLLDIAYIYSWKRNEPLRIFYRVTDIKYAINRFDFFNPELITTDEPQTDSNIPTKRKVQQKLFKEPQLLTPCKPRTETETHKNKPNLTPKIVKNNENLKPDSLKPIKNVLTPVTNNITSTKSPESPKQNKNVDHPVNEINNSLGKLAKASVDNSKVIKNKSEVVIKSEPEEGLREVKGSTVVCSEKKVLSDKLLKKGKVKSPSELKAIVGEKLTITVPQVPTPSALVSLLEKEPPVLVVDEEYEKQKTIFLNGFQLISKKVLLATPKKQPLPSTSKLPSPKIRTSPKKSPKLPDLKFNNQTKKIPKIPQIPILPKKIVHPHLTPKYLTHPVKEVAQVSSTSSLLGNPLIRKKRKYTFKTRPLGKKAKMELEQLQNLDRKALAKPKLCCVEIAPNHPSLMSDKVGEKRKHTEVKPIKPSPPLSSPHTSTPHSSPHTSTPHSSSPTPSKKANSLQTLFDTCKLNIPSSLSITLTENQDKEPPTIEPLKNQGSIRSPPMFIEIFKLPEKEPPKIPPLSSPVTTLSNGNFLVTTTGIQSLGRDPPPSTKLTKVAKQNFIPKLAESPKSTTGFQKMFEEAIKKKERSKSSTPPPLKLNVTKKPKTEDLPVSSLSPPATTTVLDLSSPVPSSSIIPIKKKVIKKPPQSNLISSTESLKRATTCLPALSVSVVSNTSQASNAHKSSPNSISSSSGSRASTLSPTEIQNQYNLTNLAQLQHVMMLRQQLEFRNSLSQLLGHQQQPPPPASIKPAANGSASPRHSGSSVRTDNNAATLLHFEKYMKSFQQQAAAQSAAAQSNLVSKK